jgi:hypothetical protein
LSMTKHMRNELYGCFALCVGEGFG